MSTHPLDPLTAQEITQATKIVRRDLDLGKRLFFEQIRLNEPNKQLVRGFTSGDMIEREAFVVAWNRDSGELFEITVSIDKDQLSSSTLIPGVQAGYLPEESDEVSRVVKAHPDFVVGLNKRGIDNLDQVYVEGLAVANFATEKERHLRLSRAHCFFIQHPSDNTHAKPIEGLIPIIDLNTMKVLRIEDSGVVPIPANRGVYQSKELGVQRKPLAELEILQPDGPDFVVDGHEVCWQNWRFRVGFTPREGLVLHTLSFNDEGSERSVIYRASLSELVVPYGDTAGDHFTNHSFDLGDGIFGRSVNSLTLGCDCLGEIHYFDVVLNDGYGNPVNKPNAICLHEEDYGILWKHTNTSTNKTEVRRSRRLVVSSFFTVGNYDYGIFWYLYLDGNIEFEAKLTGMLYSRALGLDEINSGRPPEYGSLVSPDLVGMMHEHYFNVRLDMSVDGDRNAVVEVEAKRVPMGPDNPHGNAHGVVETVLESEKDAGRDAKPENARYWKVINREAKNKLGWYPGYKLMPGPTIKPMHQPNSPFMRRAGFVNHDLWVTAFDANQLMAPGHYVNQNEFGPGIPEWVVEDRPLADTDVVLWHTMGVMHLPRPEDFPVMPVEYVGFMLKPVGFFDQNPALNLSPSKCKIALSKKGLDGQKRE
ncbi:MAG: primary-amine oxidase [Gammaproteobacteria bacterium]|nr:primary-amine oxidase [Gammaproteobacteria bacterium]